MKALYKIRNYFPSILKNKINYVLLKSKYPKIILANNIFFQLSDIIKNNILIGENTFIGENGKLYAGNNKIKIGKYCSIASDIYIITYNHSIDYISFHINQFENQISLDHEYKKGDIIIGNDVWIGNRVTILPGVKVGNGSIIGAGSVVTKDVEKYSIVGGNPAKIIRYRFNKNQIKYLESLKWWEWKKEKFKKNEHLFNKKIKELIN